LHVFFLFQETCGKSLEEIDDIFDNQSIWAFKAKKEPSRFVADIEQAKEDLDAGQVDINHVEAGKSSTV
jgi:hypothetical protein